MSNVRICHRAHPSPRVFVLVILGATLLSACAQRHDVTGSVPADFRDRHPITLARSSAVLDVFASGPTLDRRQTEDVRGFVRDYRENGEGAIIAYLPAGPGGTGARGLDGVRRALSAAGVGGRLQIAHYHPEPGTGGPIRLSFTKLQAKVESNCGYEGEEIVPTRWGANAVNRSAQNFGCAHQRNIAAQIADPRDLVRPREPGPVDGTRRLNSIERLRDQETSPIEPTGKNIETLLTRP
ncbi:MAG: CpaD family pilus assembly protein [Beijerinckiaceae bacterium]